jgi:Sulfotransferase domain
MRLPDFLAIGALKAGTTYLDGHLRSHPELCLPTAVKEVDFFSRHYDRGPVWYGKMFARCGSRLAGEVSPQYLADPRCAGRIHKLMPEVRLLVLLRDPVQRAYSQYKHWVQVTAYRGSFEEFLDAHPGAVMQGCYFSLLSCYLELFPIEQIHTIVFEDLVKSPVEVMEGVFRFLGVDTGYTPSSLDPANVSTLPRYRRAYRDAKRASDWLYDHRTGRIVVLAKRMGATRLFGRAKTDGFGEMTPAASERLSAAYRDDVGQLSTLLDRDLFATWGSITRTEAV